MANLLNGCRFTSSSSGTGSYGSGTAIAGFRNLQNAGAVNGNVYAYRAENASRTEWENGFGTAVNTAGTWTLSRTKIEASSNSNNAVNFTVPPVVFVTPWRDEFFKKFFTLTLAQADTPAIAPDFYETAFYSSAGVVGSGALYKKAGSEPSHAGKFSITLSDGVTTTWYEIAERVLYFEHFGAVGDGVTSDATAVTNALAAHSALRVPLRLGSNKSYLVGSTSFTSNSDYIQIEGDWTSKFVSTATSGTLFSFGSSRSIAVTRTISTNIVAGQATRVFLDSTSSFAAGQIALMTSTKAWYNDAREDADISAQAFSVTQAGSTTTAQLHASFTIGTPALMVGKAITFLSGVNDGYSRVVTAYNDTTKTVTFAALPSAVAASVTYRFPEAFKGQTCIVAQRRASNQCEFEDEMMDGYYVADGTAANIKEVVTVDFRDPYTPILRGFTLEGPASSADNTGLQISWAVNPLVEISVKNIRRTGCRLTGCHGGSVWMKKAEGMSDSDTGYGTQISLSAKVSVNGRGWGNRRVVDISGVTPSDRCRIHSCYIDGGGDQEDASNYWPFSGSPISNYGLGSHGPARGTIYENNYIQGVEYGIYERGRNAIIRNNTFGPYVKVPVFHSFGGRIDVYDNVVDAGLFINPDLTSELIEQTAGTPKTAYAECLITLGANLVVGQPDSSIVVRDNIVRCKQHLMQCERTGSGTLTLANLSVYNNDVEFYPTSTGHETAVFGKYPGSTSSTIALRGQQLGPNNLRTASGNTQPVLYGAEFSMAGTAADPIKFGDGRWSILLADDNVGVIPVAQLGRDKLLVSVSVEETETFYFFGWIKRNATTVTQIAGALVENLATAPTAASGTDGRLQLHLGNGKLTIGNRLGGSRTFNVEVHSMG